jgi:hypothetical protein
MHRAGFSVGGYAYLSRRCSVLSPMPKASRSQTAMSTNSTPPWQVLKKRRGQLIAASILLTIWVAFLVTMAIYR